MKYFALETNMQHISIKLYVPFVLALIHIIILVFVYV